MRTAGDNGDGILTMSVSTASDTDGTGSSRLYGNDDDGDGIRTTRIITRVAPRSNQPILTVTNPRLPMPMTMVTDPFWQRANGDGNLNVDDADGDRSDYRIMGNGLS